MSIRIPVSTPDISSVERSYLTNAFDSGWISANGEFNKNFESAWALETGSTYSLLVANGTVALHLILASLGVGPGDEVIVPSFTYIASVNAIKYVGATPVFCDSSIDTWNLRANSVRELVTDKTKAVIFVHLYGNPSGSTEIRSLCDELGIFMIEDAAEAPFASENGLAAGNIGHVASFSFFGNKILSSGEGGAVTTSDQSLYEKMKLLRDQGMSTERRYFFPEIGFNFRLTNLQAAILVGQLERKNEMMKMRHEIFGTYFRELSRNPSVIFQTITEGALSSPWLFSIRIELVKNQKISDLSNFLLNNGVETRPLFIPVSQMPPYLRYSLKEYPNAEALHKSGISLPTSSKMSSAQAVEISHLINQWSLAN